ncbi:phytoene desaturase [Emticicia oligotrophica DSM 17448]|uniref:Phytoene desaturase n=1 Tax=Emticicia oligotrophica (strain DSM 17448 / CIP 109782 / MTCC 6937 / GPTSA100-15) TaxID=929562 RepID=A0ABM5N301_EMTOG|nr:MULTISPECIES: 1-hydroxycarotenoid 3,4-desaturase CrtD [Emticicia]AFK03793.1 phytoene desaturase [Emticicia oligotrophica DSM 17448]
MKAAIIGAGIGGIATAIRLANKGYSVEVFEANDYAGGKLSEFQQGEYRFDAGPSLFTMPQFVTELFELSGKNPENYFQYFKLPEVCKYFWDDGTRLSVSADIEAFAQEAEYKLGEPAQNIIKFLKDAAFKYEVLSGLFLEDSLHKVSTWTSKKAFRGYWNLPKMGIFGTMNRANERFFKTEKAVQLFNRYATYNGSDPYQTPATLNIIPHLEYNVGAFFPKNGMYGITQSLVDLAKDLGVKFNFGVKVEEIIIENSSAKKIRVNNHELAFDKVVSNMDVTPTYRKLLPKVKHPDKILNQAKSGSGLIFYWGIKQQFAQLGLHNIFFSNNYKAEFEHQFQKKTIYHDPTIYLNITSKCKADDAPEGCENWFLLINAPANEGQDWEKIIASTRQNIINKLSKNLGVNIGELIENESILDPRTIELRTSSAQGALYGNSSNNKFAAFLRHANFSSEIKNLYFVGGSVHPGGGIPLALSSAKIVADLIE